MRRPQCNSFYHISAYKSTYGQDRTIALMHMLSAQLTSLNVLIYGKVYIETFRNVSTLEMCECYSCTLDIGGVTG